MTLLVFCLTEFRHKKSPLQDHCKGLGSLYIFYENLIVSNFYRRREFCSENKPSTFTTNDIISKHRKLVIVRALNIVNKILQPPKRYTHFVCKLLLC